MDILSTLFQQQSRRIGLIVPSVVISEKHDDSLEITEHPVEVGAAISDHAFRRPSEVVMQVGFAGGGSLLDFVDTSSLGLSVGIGPKETYQELLNLQSSRVPLDVVTGKRIYTNMLIRALEVNTDRTSENILCRADAPGSDYHKHNHHAGGAKDQYEVRGEHLSRAKLWGENASAKKNESILSRLSGFVAGG